MSPFCFDIVVENSENSNNSFRGDTFDETVFRSMNSQRIINELLTQGQDTMTPEIQDRMIDIITGK